MHSLLPPLFSTPRACVLPLSVCTDCRDLIFSRSECMFLITSTAHTVFLHTSFNTGIKYRFYSVDLISTTQQRGETPLRPSHLFYWISISVLPGGASGLNLFVTVSYITTIFSSRTSWCLRGQLPFSSSVSSLSLKKYRDVHPLISVSA